MLCMYIVYMHFIIIIIIIIVVVVFVVLIFLLSLPFLFLFSTPLFTRPSSSTRFRLLVLGSNFIGFGTIWPKSGTRTAAPIVGLRNGIDSSIHLSAGIVSTVQQKQ